MCWHAGVEPRPTRYQQLLRCVVCIRDLGTRWARGLGLRVPQRARRGRGFSLTLTARPSIDGSEYGGAIMQGREVRQLNMAELVRACRKAVPKMHVLANVVTPVLPCVAAYTAGLTARMLTATRTCQQRVHKLHPVQLSAQLQGGTCVRF